jgi:hypothetical protein
MSYCHDGSAIPLLDLLVQTISQKLLVEHDHLLPAAAADSRTSALAASVAAS